ncbi:Mfs1.2 [Marasmius fiardii PR-910]|nr:Mfs1.2 [Marasmius fiardii PR-910]
MATVATKESSLDSSNTPTRSSKKGARFWLILLSLFLSIFLAAVEVTAVSTALPAIIADLQGEQFVWVGTVYPLASTAFLPMSGGIAEIFGRRPAILIALGLFTLGSALCGAAQSTRWLIAARIVQGLGGGGIQSLSSIIISDLVSLQERGSYNAVLGLAWACACAVGPLVGGALANQGQWRWVFYLNLPICGVTIGTVMVFLRLPIPPGTLQSKLRKMDWIGNFIVISSTTAVVIGLTWGGVVYPWSSARVLTPLILGLVGLLGFVGYEALWARNPILPISLLSNISSVSGYIQTFINSVGVLCLGYYLPVYYQACKDASLVRSSVNILPLTFASGFFVIAAGISVTIAKRYRPQIWFGWILYVIGVGVLSMTGPSSPLSQGVGLPFLSGAAMGILASTLYFPVLAPLDVTQNAYALAFFTFCRSFAGVRTLPMRSSTFRPLISSLLFSVAPRFGGSPLALSGANADELYALIPKIRFLNEPVKSELQSAFGESLDVIWETLTGIMGIGFLASLLMKDIPLQNVRDEKWAISESGERELDE